MARQQPHIHGILAEFDGPEALLNAARQITEAGYRKFDCHSPFPVHGMDDAMGLKRSPLGYMVGVMAFAGLGAITALIYWTSAVDYPLVISGKPFFSYQAFVPPVFAITILTAALTATLGMLALNQLPKLFHPLFTSERFAKVTNDGFFVSVEAGDRLFDERETAAFLESLGATNTELVRSDGEK